MEVRKLTAEEAQAAGMFLWQEPGGSWRLVAYCGDAADWEIPAEVDSHPVVRVNDDAFLLAPQLENVAFPPSVQEIGRKIFAPENAAKTLTLAADRDIHIQPNALENTKDLTLILTGTQRKIQLDAVLKRTKIARILALQLSPEDFPGSLQKNLLLNGYVFAAMKGLPLPEGCAERYDRYLRTHKQGREYLFSRAAEPVYLRFLVEKELILSLDDCEQLEALYRKAENPESMAMLLRYRREHFTEKQREAYRERQLGLREPTVQEMRRFWRFSLRPDGTLEITGYLGTEECVRVPERIGKRAVMSVGFAAFSPFKPRISNADARRKLREVVLPDGIAKIGCDAFCGCQGLENVSLPDTLKIVEDGAFSECTALREMKFPDSVERLGDGVLRGCVSLKRAAFPAGLRRIPVKTCDGCFALESVKFPAEAEVIRWGAFALCTRLGPLKLPDSVYQVEAGAFDCELLPGNWRQENF